jgi:hypothetical protein
VTKEDLKQFGIQLIDALYKAIQTALPVKEDTITPEWLKSRVVRKLLDISAGSLQNLRITGRIRYKKVVGSYYYNRSDLTSLFAEDNKETHEKK